MTDKLVQLEIPFPPVPFRAKDQIHLVFELFVHNQSDQMLTLTCIESAPLDHANAPIQVLEGKAIEDNIRYLNNKYRPTEEPKLIAGGIACVFFWLSFDQKQNIPQVFRHTITYHNEQGEKQSASVEMHVQARKPLLVHPPLRGKGWVAAGGVSNTTGHRRTPLYIDEVPYFAQRYAVDWLQFGLEGGLFKDAPEKNESWYCYGADLLAVSDGIVTAIQDGIIENVPLAEKKAIEITLETAPGNYVLLDLGDENYALYAHMLPGSLQVQAGDRLKSGQVIGKLGNSGNSDAPHLHFHIGHRNSTLGTHGLPYHLRSFEWIGNVGNDEEKLMAILEKKESWQPEKKTIQRREELVIENDVVNF